MGVENLIGFQFGFWMREEKFLHQITVFTDVHGSFDSDVPRHNVVLVADVVMHFCSLGSVLNLKL